ncbi:hypothetical protein COLO4_36630 [Corchorus olitorius]|uniref:Uncharacterized protein n=1 Tax=Corchorus olitorius TaxID=93759 RepID=A0A1R3G752_9ROSI|nr:hypothetical protein COLO4_36630 [Corchorus olitorius]
MATAQPAVGKGGVGQASPRARAKALVVSSC